jgi:hypothetical protein
MNGYRDGHGRQEFGNITPETIGNVKVYVRGDGPPVSNIGRPPRRVAKSWLNVKLVDATKDFGRWLSSPEGLRTTALPHMIEIEFLDESDIMQRFYRWGTDSTMMIRPLPLGPPRAYKP